jgi:hypothetical protein
MCITGAGLAVVGILAVYTAHRYSEPPLNLAETLTQGGTTATPDLKASWFYPKEHRVYQWTSINRFALNCILMVLQPRLALIYGSQAACQLVKFGSLARWQWVIVESPIDLPSEGDRLLGVAKMRFFIPPYFKQWHTAFAHEKEYLISCVKFIGACATRSFEKAIWKVWSAQTLFGCNNYYALLAQPTWLNAATAAKDPPILDDIRATGTSVQHGLRSILITTREEAVFNLLKT